ncbi:MAG: hypothetical protein GF411_14490 [Candidatus Lokiarchaeota archaeon]|nr:hypothetical protein [Candidatus Lokiarchaeota archaeon]
MNCKLRRLVGRTVRLKDETCMIRHGEPGDKSKTAKIERVYDDIEGGVRLDRQLDGFYSWNIEDLEIMPANDGDEH